VLIEASILAARRYSVRLEAGLAASDSQEAAAVDAEASGCLEDEPLDLGDGLPLYRRL
jgi:hypothetical protein